MHIQFDEPFSSDDNKWAYTRQRLVQETGWSLEYIDCLSYADVAEYWAVFSGQAKVQEHRAEIKAQRAASRARRRGR